SCANANRAPHDIAIAAVSAAQVPSFRRLVMVRIPPAQGIVSDVTGNSYRGLRVAGKEIMGR
ncbi:MAG: hypothetical protein WA823_00455, partial [Candidatus Acidiferrales bacterium]